MSKPTCGQCAHSIPDASCTDRVICDKPGCVYRGYTTDRDAAACDKFKEKEKK